MTLVRAISDIHGFTPEIEVEPCDLLLIAGDIMPVTDHGTGVQRRYLVGQFAEWLRAQPAEQVVLVGGNHDFLFEKEWAWRYVDDLPENVHYLRDSSAEVFGLKIHGMPWSFCPEGWAFRYLHESHAWNICQKIEENTDILVSHGPPLGFGDKVLGNGPQLGSRSLLERLKVVWPRLCVFGHIHEGHGRWEWPRASGEQMVLANVSALDETYEVIHSAQSFAL